MLRERIYNTINPNGEVISMILNTKTLLLLAGWILAGLASVALIAQHMKWTEQQSRWQAELNQQQQRVVELELIIAGLHTDIDESGPGLNEAATKTGTAISNVFDRVRSTFSRGGVPSE